MQNLGTSMKVFRVLHSPPPPPFNLFAPPPLTKSRGVIGPPLSFEKNYSYNRDKKKFKY